MLLWVLVLLTGVYGGYFGAAQGVLLLAALGALLDSNLQRVNALKNVLTSLVNLVAGVLFIIFAHPNWTYVAIIAVSSAIGGQLGAVVGRRLPPLALRVVIVVVGLAALTKFLFFYLTPHCAARTALPPERRSFGPHNCPFGPHERSGSG